jgi:hypothetical protein
MPYKFNPFTSNLDIVVKPDFTEFVYNSTGSQSKNRYNNWSDLVTAIAGVEGIKTIVFEQDETLPAGTYTLENCILKGNGFPPAAGGLTITLANGFVLNEVSSLTLDNFLKVKSVSSSAIMTITSQHNLLLNNNSLISSTTKEFYYVGNGLMIIIAVNGSQIIDEGYEVIRVYDTGFLSTAFLGGGTDLQNDTIRGDGSWLLYAYDVAPIGDYINSTHANFTGSRTNNKQGIAEYLKYDNTTSGLTATDVQGAIDELSTGAGGEVYTYQDGPDYAASYVYVGYKAVSGKWYIYRRTYSGDVREYATGTSNYSTNWTNRVGLTYS